MPVRHGAKTTWTSFATAFDGKYHRPAMDDLNTILAVSAVNFDKLTRCVVQFEGLSHERKGRASLKSRWPLVHLL